MANALNFTYEIQPPSDGGLWGGVSKDGIGNGLVGDIKVNRYFAIIYINQKVVTGCQSTQYETKIALIVNVFGFPHRMEFLILDLLLYIFLQKGKNLLTI